MVRDKKIKTDDELLIDFMRANDIDGVHEKRVRESLCFQRYLLSVRIDGVKNEIVNSFKGPVKYVVYYSLKASPVTLSSLIVLIAIVIFLTVLVIEILHPL